MPGENLTREEARARAGLLEVTSYDVDLDLTVGEKTFRSTTTVRFGAQPGATTFIDLIAPQVNAVTLNGRSLDPLSAFDGARIALDDLGVDNELVVDAECAYMHTGEGLHRFVDPVDSAVYLYTQFEVIDARRMFACFDQPDLKATYAFTVTAPANWEVISNSPTPEPEPLDDDRGTWRFAPTPRMSTYITALIAGPYHGVRAEHRGIPMGVFCRRSLAEYLDADEVLDTTQRGFDFFEQVFDQPYPFTKYDQIFVPEFNAGAMENAGAVTFLEDYVFRSKVTDASYERRAETILHELAHMWFGDLVTMRWWDDLWLNESFATYASVLCQTEATRWTDAWTTFTNLEKTWAYRQDQLPSTHPIAADIRDIEDVEVNFDGITYAKGASVLKQLVAWVGRDHFVAGLRSYFVRHAWANTELSDLLTALEEQSGRDLHGWTKEWLETAGVNTLRPSFDVDADGRFSRFEVQQTAPADYPVLRSHRLAIGLYDLAGDELVRRHRVELDVLGAATAVPDLVGQPQPDLVLLNDDDLTYAKIRLDDRSRRTLVGHIAAVREPLPRALCWSAAWDMTRDAEMPARDFVELVVGGIAHESDVGMMQALLRQAASALHLFGDPARREHALVDYATALHALVLGAEPGTDSQLALLRAFASVARTDEQLAWLAGLLDGSMDLAGLTVDTDLRWTLLRRLVATGRFGDNAIEAELARDDTATGRRHAAATQAARPTPEAKEEAWASTVERDDLPNALLRATVEGFAHPDQAGLTRPFIDRYFEAVPSVWSTRTNESAQTIVLGLFPALLPEQPTVDRARRFLADTELPPALRRLVVEGVDGLERSLRAQACDRSA